MAERLTDTELDELARLEREATARSTSRWICSPRPDGTAQVYAPSMGPARRVVPIAETTTEDGHMIAAARNTVVRLIAEVRELRAEVAQLRADYDAKQDTLMRTKQNLLESSVAFEKIARADERAKVVACLRANLSGIDACPNVDDAADIVDDAISAIERGEHRR